MSHPLASLMRRLVESGTRFVVIGVSGANLYAPAGQAVFSTEDVNLFLPLEADNLVRAWAGCEDAGLDLWVGADPLDRPRDRWLAERVIEHRALTRASGPDSVAVALTLIMEGFDFETVWAERRLFTLEGVDLPTARLTHIVQSKHLAGRPKDRLFLATHRDALEQLLKRAD
jgi:hypothetical protein